MNITSLLGNRLDDLAGRTRLPWFRVHIVLLNDPGRLISVHLMHTALVTGWAGSMLVYETLVADLSDPVVSPSWRQGMYVLTYSNRLGLSTSAVNIGTKSWAYETVISAHAALSGLLILASLWHWSFWDLDLFSGPGIIGSGPALNLLRAFGIHLTLAGYLCFTFGYFHLTGCFGPGIYTSDSAGLIGPPHDVKPDFTLQNLGPFTYGAVPAHHVGAGFLALLTGPWHVVTKPSPTIHRTFTVQSTEGTLSSAIAAVFVASLIIQAQAWYCSGAVSALELFGPTRFHWDAGYFSQNLEARMFQAGNVSVQQAWEAMPEKLMFYDYLGTNPAKGGLFRAGPMIRGDGVASAFAGHSAFEIEGTKVSARRMPAFFEGFPVLIIDLGGRLRADIPFRRAESRFSIEQTAVRITFQGGILNGTCFSGPVLVKNYARKAVLGEIFGFSKKIGDTSLADGVLRTSARAWFSFAHLNLGLIFFSGHLWHGSRSLFSQIWTGVRFESQDLEYGANEKLGDEKSKTSAFL